MSTMPDSLLKQILERLPCVVRSCDGGCRCFFLPCHSHFVELAIVPCIFAWDSNRDRLHALEAAARIEVSALLAGVQFEAALGTLAGCWHSLQHGAALGAARDGVRAGQIDGTRTESIVSLCGGWTRGAEARFFAILPRLAVAVLIAVLPVFCCHKTSKDAGVLSRQSLRKTSLKLGAC
jgi:hypothetical protein